MRKLNAAVPNNSLFIAGAIVLGFLVTLGQATCLAAERSLVGTWKLGSVKVDEKEVMPGFRSKEVAVNAIWKLKKNGTGSMGGYEITRWKYNPEEGELEIFVPGIFVKEWKYCSADVKWKNGNAHLRFHILFSIMELELIPDN